MLREHRHKGNAVFRGGSCKSDIQQFENCLLHKPQVSSSNDCR